MSDLIHNYDPYCPVCGYGTAGWCGCEERQSRSNAVKNIKAILSTTLLQVEGTYRFTMLDRVTEGIGSIPHYVGHPATRYILDQMGATYTPGYFEGTTKVGDTYIVAQLKDPRKGQAFTVDHPNVTAEDLKWSMVERLS